MRIADFIIEYIYSHGTDTVFTIAGGGAMYLNDAVAIHKKMKYICNHHEEACAYAAGAYAMYKGVPGCAMLTSGPGSSNAVTGVLEAWQNSTPVVFISSQAPRKYMGVTRSFGVQEASIIPIVSSITKFAAVLKDSLDVKNYMDKAYKEMLGSRPGPIWLDIPMDIANSKCTVY